MKAGQNAVHALTGREYRIVSRFLKWACVAYKVSTYDRTTERLGTAVRTAWLPVSLLDEVKAKPGLVLGDYDQYRAEGKP